MVAGANGMAGVDSIRSVAVGHGTAAPRVFATMGVLLLIAAGVLAVLAWSDANVRLHFQQTKALKRAYKHRERYPGGRAGDVRNPVGRLLFTPV